MGLDTNKSITIPRDINVAISTPTREFTAIPTSPTPKSRSKIPDSNLFSTPSENASRTPANTQPAAFDNPLPSEKEKLSPSLTASTFHTVESGQTFYSISRSA